MAERGKTKSWLKSEGFRAWRNELVAEVGPTVLRIWFGGMRIRVGGPGLRPGRAAEREPVIWAFWHERLMIAAWSHRFFGIRALISRHGDGEMIARLAERMGCPTFRGSSTRGGARVMREMVKALRPGGEVADIAITPDGPKGPRRRCQIGTVFLASQSGLAIVPGTVAYEHYWTAPSWDQFVLPKPGTRAMIWFGEPIHVPAGLNPEALASWAEQVGTRLDEFTHEHDVRWRERWSEGMSLDEFRRWQGESRSTTALGTACWDLRSRWC